MIIFSSRPNFVVFIFFNTIFHDIQVVGGVDEHLPSLPSTSGVKVISYLKLLDQVVEICCQWWSVLTFFIFFCFVVRLLNFVLRNNEAWTLFASWILLVIMVTLIQILKGKNKLYSSLLSCLLNGDTFFLINLTHKRISELHNQVRLWPLLHQFPLHCKARFCISSSYFWFKVQKLWYIRSWQFIFGVLWRIEKVKV